MRLSLVAEPILNPLRALTLLLALSGVRATAIASEADVSPALRAHAEAVCRDDAIRLCADVISDEAAIIACMRLTRGLVACPCRQAFHAVVGDLRR